MADVTLLGMGWDWDPFQIEVRLQIVLPVHNGAANTEQTAGI
jgi:hypothetical protein